MSAGSTLVRFARHEARLAWRDWLGMMSGNRTGRERAAILGVALFMLALHVMAYGMVGDFARFADNLDTHDRLVVTGAAFFTFALMLAQALESVTRVVYGRADLDLIASSPAPLPTVFALRAGIAAISTTTMTVIIVGPFVDALALRGGARWLSAYGVVAAMGLAAATVAIAITLALLRFVGPRRTRTAAQIAAAIIGAGFVIGAQAIGIFAYGEMGRFSMFRSPALLEAVPGPDSLLWWPARAAMGDVAALAGALVGAVAVFALAVAVAAPRFARYAVVVAGTQVDGVPTGRAAARRPLKARSAAGYLRAKELRLLGRDPWLISQTLMQVLYLIPPALMLWKGFGSDEDAPVMLAPMVAMAAGQLAGGLAWLAVSGEDAPDLVATAPIGFAAAIRAKIEAVMMAVAVPVAPLLLGFALVDPWVAAVAAAGVALSAASATAIQFLFRKAAKRSHFRRRQTASRVATFAEAFSSISWAGATGLAAASSWYAVAPAGFAAAVLALAWAVSPRHP
ncbi:permease [Oharaeibacter diazotrophicus]|uniref:ABC-2 type transport system permease protein n=1 Tax=Oharaeibacter diazotrophicus TaxID=1920512 RepID=A0A4R6RIG1_9HYPH|nr:permease [Oharaeibacter diazotrophicus]TDP86299.1 ABC-2 type transport system permease protein [Oharaeibacter diazotrophicus]BBE71758.1 hypothetical protein OHA_1_01341 [Pleomorphomonas sp. SM30]GLS78524.1 hypothetical protein GCM10007904_38610 [Oharaeibacter diazotrophicus]